LHDFIHLSYLLHPSIHPHRSPDYFTFITLFSPTRSKPNGRSGARVRLN